ncbi:MAG: hypothetical protein ABIX46_14905 [Burkholderiaceae bacterium]
MADRVSAEALAALENAVANLLPVDVPAGLTRRIRVQPRDIRPLGLGAYVGRHVGPDASLSGRRVSARVDVDVSGGDDGIAQSYVGVLAGQVLAQTRSQFVQRGMQRVRGVSGDDRRAIAFDVDFEYVPVPAASDGVIDHLALAVYANLTPYPTRLRADFDAAALATLAAPLVDFTPADDPQAAPPGAWSVIGGAAPALRQSAATGAGSTALDDPQKAGAQLLWRPRGTPLALARFVAILDVASASPDGIGLVFARRAADDYRFFLASQRHRYHLFGRRSAAGWQTLASAPFGFDTAAPQRFVIGVHDRALFAQLDERRTLGATSDEPLPAGEIGLLTHANDAARFLAARLMELT